MDQSLLILLLILLVIILSCVLFYRTRRHRRRHSGQEHHTTHTKKRLFRRTDHGQRIAQMHGHARSPLWAGVAKAHRLLEPGCVVCGYKGSKVQVHHIKPFHLNPLLELDPHNLITLCEARGREHHLLLGHLDNWESYNVHIREDAKRYHHKTEKQIRADPHWQKTILQRPQDARPVAHR